MDILRFTTAGSVDDGKSTLIGRLLYETGTIKDDILQSVSTGSHQLNLAHITDGLRAERDQGITIDVAYKYFSTDTRKYIITDAPGHFQYTKNLVTGASAVDVMIILVDARNGITAQTKRHSQVAAFLKIKHVVIAVNKMDAVGYSQSVFDKITQAYQHIAESLSIKIASYIPVSALLGDNVSTPSKHMPWYFGATLLHFLEHYNIEQPKQTDDVRFVVQYVVDEDDAHKICYAGKLLSGILYTGDTVFILPILKQAKVQKINSGYTTVKKAVEGENVCIFLDSGQPLKRGDIVSSIFNKMIIGKFITAELCWLDANDSMQKGKEYLLRLNAAEYKCKVVDLFHKIDADSLEKQSGGEAVLVNEFAYVRIEIEKAIAFDLYVNVPENGRGILIHPVTNNTAGALILY